MRYAIVEGAKVVNVAVADAPMGENWIASEAAQIGDSYADGAFTAPAPTVAVPQKVTRRQAKAALLLAGKLSAVQPAIDAIADPTQRAMMQLEWDESLEFERTRPALVAMGSTLGLDAAALDALFIQAAKL